MGAEFQYPLRVEVGCNSKIRTSSCQKASVSVPSTGRSGLQPRPRPPRPRPRKVSVPSTGRSGLQRVTRFGRSATLFVSVPSTGRSGLQLERPAFNPRLYYEFQYPLRVEVGCNLIRTNITGAISTCFSTLYGSKWVATNLKNELIEELLGFSTLYGSKWVATYAHASFREWFYKFQYPLRVEVGCNSDEEYRRVDKKMFQYPLRVEVGCNFPYRKRYPRSSMFQYPLRVEVGCNGAQTLCTRHRV